MDGGVVEVEDVKGTAEVAARLALGRAEQAEEQVLGADVAVVGALGLFLGERQHMLRPLAEPLERIDGDPSSTRLRLAAGSIYRNS